MKKVFLILSLATVFVCLLAFSVSAAEPSYADGEWIYAADGVTKITLRDTDGNPLIWYMNGEELKYVRADQTDKTQDVYVEYTISAGGSGFDTSKFAPQKTLKGIKIFDNGTEIIGSGTNLSAQKIVLMNLERLDVDAFNGWLFGNKNGCCPMLRGIYLPSTLKGIGQEGFTCTKLVQIWNLENTQLYYMNACSFAAANTLTQEATGGVIRMPKAMLMPLNIQGSKVETYIMNPDLDYPTMNHQWNQFFRDCSKLQKIVVPAQARIGFGEEAFRGTPAQYLVFITGTEQDAIDMRTNTKDRNGYWDNSRFTGADIISYDTYLSDQATYDNSTNKVYIVYGYNYCEAFYDGAHAMLGEETAMVENYFAQITIGDICTRAECAMAVVTDTIAPIFVDYGYSVTETEVGGKLSMSQFYGINKDSLETYIGYTGKSFEFGFVVSVSADPLNEENSDLIEANRTYIMPSRLIAHECFGIAVTGFTSANADKALTFCLYVKDGEEAFYLDNGETVKVVTMKSYNDVKALVGENVTEQ